MYDEPTGGSSSGGGGWIGDVAMAAAAITDSINQTESAKKDRKAARELTEYAYSKDLDMWHLQNIYNSPAEQMKRLKAAGLNPNLIYGGSPGNQAAEMPKYQAPRPEYKHKALQVLPMMEVYQNFSQKQAQIDYVRSQQKLAEEKQLTEAVNRVSKKAKAKMDTELAKYSYDLAFERINKEQLQNAIRQNQERRTHIEIGTARSKRESAASEAVKKQVEARYASKYGLRMSDAIQYRIAAKIMDMLGITF